MTDPRWLEGSRDPVAAELRRALDDARDRSADEVALRRVWGKVAYVEPEVRNPRWFWFAGGVACSTMLTAALVVMLWPRSTGIDPRNDAPVAATETKGTTTPSTPSDYDAEAASSDIADDLAPVPRLVRTAASETMRLALKGGIEARVGARSVLNLGGADKERPSVDRGTVGFKVPRQPPGKTFSVDVGPYRIVVVGTSFRLGHHGRRVVVDVDEGVVEIRRGRRLARLTAGESWAGPVREPQAPRYRVATTRPAGVSASLSGSPSVSSFGLPAAPAVETPWPTLVSSSSPSVAIPAPTPAPLRTSAPGTAPAAPAPTASSADARAALAEGDFHRALELYRGIRARGGPAAENADYEIGMILRDRLKRPSKAIAIWRRYRAEHPEGLLRTEADVSIIETLIRGGETEAALAEAQEFLLRHPGSERRAEIASVAGDLYRSAGECGRAVNAYDVALTSPRARKVADAATFYRAVCLTALNQDEGRAGLRVYLRDFANGRYRDQATRLLQGSDRGAP